MIIMYVGPMCSGKSGYLVEAGIKYKLANKNWIGLQSSLNTRDKGWIKSRGRGKIPATMIDVSKPNWLKTIGKLIKNHKNIIIDELFMFPQTTGGLSLIDTIRYYQPKRKILIASLDFDFRGVPYPIVEKLMMYANQIHKVQAICYQCSSESAHLSQMLIKQNQLWIPAPYHATAPTEGADTSIRYAPACERCHEVPGAPLLQVSRI